MAFTMRSTSDWLNWVKTAAAALARLTRPSRYAARSSESLSVASGIWMRSRSASHVLISAPLVAAVVHTKAVVPAWFSKLCNHPTKRLGVVDGMLLEPVRIANFPEIFEGSIRGVRSQATAFPPWETTQHSEARPHECGSKGAAKRIPQERLQGFSVEIGLAAGTRTSHSGLHQRPAIFGV